MRLRILLFELSGRCLRPGLLRARLRSVAFGELYPSYPYRDCLILNYVFCVVFQNCLIFFGDAFGPGYSGLAYARLPSAN